MDERQLKELLNSEAIPPADENARKRALNLALAAYDEAQGETQKNRQGFGLLARLTGRSNNRSGRRDMKITKKWTLIAGTATASVALLGVLTYATMDVWRPYQDKEVDVAAAVDTGKTNLPESEDGRIDLAFRDTEKKAKEQTDANKTEELARQPEASAERGFAGPAKGDRQRAESDTSAVTTLAKPAPAPRSQAAPPSQGILGMFGAADQPAQPQGRTSGGIALQDTRNQKLRSESFGIYPPPPGDAPPSHYKDVGRDKFEAVTENPITRVADAPVSTFSTDVDTAAYAFVRRMLNRGVMPQKNAVRIEEMVNYFDYAYPLPETRKQPFHPSVTVMPSPWKKGNKLVHIGIKGYDIAAGEKPRSNLVFLLDVSGSMNAPDKLPLMVSSLKLLLNTLKANDTVAIVVYAGAAGTVLEPTKVAEKQKILAALDRLQAGEIGRAHV